MLIEGTPSVVGKRIEDGALLQRYHSEIIQSYTRKTGNKVFASHFLQGSAHYTHVRQLLENKAHGDSFETKLALLSGPAQQNYLTLCNQKPPKFEPSVESYNGLKPCVEKEKPSFKKHKKIKSGKRRRLKSSNKKKKQHTSSRQGEKCSKEKENFSLNVTKIVAKSTNMVPVSSLRQATKQSLQSNLTQLPSSILSYSKQYKSPYAENLVKGNVPNESPTITCFPPCVSKSKSPSLTSSVTSKHEEDLKLPPHPPIMSSSPSSLKASSKSTDEVKKSSPATLESLGKHSLEAKNFKKILKENSLKDRLNLIHCYGNNYMAVAKQYETKQKKEAALKDYKEKIAEKAEKEKQKMIQRKKIHALNRLMTSLENEQFMQFMNSIAPPITD